MKSNPEKNQPDLSILSPGVQQELATAEVEAQQELTKFATRLEEVAKHGTKTLEETLNESGIKLQDKDKTKEIFKQTILQRLEDVASSLLKYALKREESAPFNIMLLEAVINVLDGIQDFKTKIDKVMPIKCDEIMKHAAPALLVVASAYSPALGLALKNTGLLEKTATFLKDENLKSTIDKFRDNLETLNKEKGLDVASRTSELSEQTGISTTILDKLGFSPQILGTVIKGVSEIPSIKTFMKEVSSYADKVFPQSEKEIDETLQAIKKSTISAMEKTGAPKELVEKVGAQIDKHLTKAEASLKKNLDPKVSVFDKMKNQQNSANLMLDCIKDITGTIKANVPDPKNATAMTGAAVEALKKGIQDRLQGNMERIVMQVQDPKVKEFAKKALGAGHANLMDIAKGAVKKDVGSSRSM